MHKNVGKPVGVVLRQIARITGENDLAGVGADLRSKGVAVSTDRPGGDDGDQGLRTGQKVANKDILDADAGRRHAILAGHEAPVSIQRRIAAAGANLLIEVRGLEIVPIDNAAAAEISDLKSDVSGIRAKRRVRTVIEETIPAGRVRGATSSTRVNAAESRR